MPYLTRATMRQLAADRRQLLADLATSQANEKQLAAGLRAVRGHRATPAATAAGRLRSEIDGLHQLLHDQHMDSREVRRETTSLRRRLARALKACVRYRAEAQTLRSVNRELQRQLEDALYSPAQRDMLEAGGMAKLASVGAR